MQTAASVPLSVPPAAREVLWGKWITLALLAYWGVFALVAPVMNWDSQTYNLSRLYVAHQGGLFGNTAWSSARQVFFPWTFDAIHYPFLPLLRGYCLPSFAWLVGVLVVVYRLVSMARTPAVAWWCCLSLLSLPTLIFQSICTKNDVAVVFALACWFYAWRLWRETGRDRYVGYMALALCFGAGAKTTGLPYLGVLGLFTTWHLRGRPGQAGRFVGLGIVFFLLFGSVETYLNNWLVYHAFLGPKEVIAPNVNHDGLAGAVATFIRWCFGNMNIGVDAPNPTSPFPGWMEDACRGFLRLVGLQDLGYRATTGDTDANMRFLKLGFDVGSDYGPVGALAIIGGLIFLFARPWTDPIWKLAAAGFATLALTSYTIAWMMWDARFLVQTFALLTLGLSLWVFSLGTTGAGRCVRTFFQVLVVYSAIIYPLYSVAKKPSDLVKAVRHRLDYEMTERPLMLEIASDVRRLKPAIGSSPLLLLGSDDSWMLCILEIRGLHVLAAGALDQKALEAASRDRAGSSPRPVYVLYLDRPLDPGVEPLLTLVSKYQEPNSALYRWQPPAVPAPSPAPTP